MKQQPYNHKMTKKTSGGRHIVFSSKMIILYIQYDELYISYREYYIKLILLIFHNTHNRFVLKLILTTLFLYTYLKFDEKIRDGLQLCYIRAANE